MTRFFRIVLPTISGLSKVSKAISGIMFGFLGFEFWDLSQFYNPHKLKRAKTNQSTEEKKLYALKA